MSKNTGEYSPQPGLPGAVGVEDDGKQDYAGGDGNRPDEAAGIMQEEVSREREVDGIAILKLGEIRVAETAREGKSIFAVVLEAAAVELLRIVERGVIGAPAADEAEVETCGAGLLEHRQVRIVGHVLVNFVCERGAGRMWRGLREKTDEAAIARAGLKHLRWAGIAAGFEIDIDADVFCPGMLGNKSGGTEETVFFAIGEEDDEVILQCRSGAKGAKRFEKSCDTRAVVPGSRTCRDRVVMRHEG